MDLLYNEHYPKNEKMPFQNHHPYASQIQTFNLFVNVDYGMIMEADDQVLRYEKFE